MLNFICSLWDTTSKSHLPWKLLPPCPSMLCSQQDLPFPALLSPLLLLAHATIWGSCWHHKEWLQETLHSWTFFPWKIIWLLAFIFVWNNVGKTYLNDNCTQILSVKRDMRNHTERIQEATWFSLPFLIYSFCPFSAFHCIRQKLQYVKYHFCSSQLLPPNASLLRSLEGRLLQASFSPMYVFGSS